MNKKVFEALGFTVELTLLANACVLIVTESTALDVDTWRVSMQTPYDPLPTVVNLDEGASSNEILDNMVKSLTKKAGLPIAASINIPPESINPTAIQNLNKIILESISNLRVPNVNSKNGG